MVITDTTSVIELALQSANCSAIHVKVRCYIFYCQSPQHPDGFIFLFFVIQWYGSLKKKKKLGLYVYLLYEYVRLNYHRVLLC